MKKILCGALFLMGAAPIRAELWPQDSNIANVKDYGARGDGQDDTQAIRRAISENVGYSNNLFFPCGTYSVTGPLEWKKPNSAWGARLALVGERRDCVVLKLMDGAVGYGSAATPKSFIVTGSLNGGSGNEGFQNSIIDMTINCGSGNPGVRCVDFLANNQGTMRNVTVISGDGLGLAGVYLGRQYPGPGLIKNVRVEGFDYGVQIDEWSQSMTLTNVEVVRQNRMGINLGRNALFMEKLKSVNTVPAIGSNSIFSNHAYFTLIGADFSGGAGDRAAIEVNNQTKFYVRDVRTSGYRSAMKRGATFISETALPERASHPTLKLFDGTPDMPMKLPIEQAPEPYYSSDFGRDWASVQAHGARVGDNVDDAPAIRAAIATGRPIIYFPKRTAGGGDPNRVFYDIGSPIDVPPTVKRIIFGGTYIRPFGPFGPGQGMFRITGGAPGDVLTIEGVWARNSLSGGHWIDHNSPRTLYVRNVLLGGGNISLVTHAGAGKTFLEDYLGVLRIEGGQVWARQLNIESALTNIVNDGGKLWILGYKTEKDSTAIKTLNGGRTELLGGFLMPAILIDTPYPISTGFVSENGHQSLSYIVWHSAQNQDFPIHVEETRDGQTLRLSSSAVVAAIPNPAGTTRRFVPLFNGYVEEAAPGLRAAMAVGVPGALSAMDAQVKSRLESMGFSVTLIDDDRAASTDITGQRLLFISRSVDENKVGAAFKDAPVPMLVSEAFLYRAMKMTTGANKAFVTNSADTVTIIAAGHPLTAGFSRLQAVRVYPTPGKMSLGLASAGGVNAANLGPTGTSGAWASFGYDRGATMDEGFIAPARRVGFFLDSAVPEMTAEGWRLFDNAVVWAADVPPAAAMAVGVPGALSAMDAQVKSRLESMGFSVTLIDDDRAASTDIAGQRLLFISRSVDENKVGAAFKDTPVPVLVSEAFLYRAMKMTTGANKAFVTNSADTVTIIAAGHPLTAGFSHLQAVRVYPTPGKMSLGLASAGGVNAANLGPTGTSGAWASFGYDRGATMDEGFIAPARRVGFFLDSAVPEMTAEGWRLFDNAVGWASGR